MQNVQTSQNIASLALDIQLQNILDRGEFKKDYKSHLSHQKIDLKKSQSDLLDIKDKEALKNLSSKQKLKNQIAKLSLQKVLNLFQKIKNQNLKMISDIHKSNQKDLKTVFKVLKDCEHAADILNYDLQNQSLKDSNPDHSQQMTKEIQASLSQQGIMQNILQSSSFQKRQHALQEQKNLSQSQLKTLNKMNFLGKVFKYGSIVLGSALGPLTGGLSAFGALAIQTGSQLFQTGLNFLVTNPLNKKFKKLSEWTQGMNQYMQRLQDTQKHNQDRMQDQKKMTQKILNRLQN